MRGTIAGHRRHYGTLSRYPDRWVTGSEWQRSCVAMATRDPAQLDRLARDPDPEVQYLVACSSNSWPQTLQGLMLGGAREDVQARASLNLWDRVAG